jgi:hypothetical protein
MTNETRRFRDTSTEMYSVQITLTEEEAEEISKMLSLKMEQVKHLKEQYGDQNTKIRMKDFLSGISRFKDQLYLSKMNNAELGNRRKVNINAR